MVYKILVAMSILFGMFIVPLCGQDGMSISVFENPETFVFSNQNDFETGVNSTITLLVSSIFGQPENENDDPFRQWEVSINAEGDLNNGGHTIPISSISARAIGNSQFRSTGKVFISTQTQALAKKISSSTDILNSFIEIQLKTSNEEHFLKPRGEYSTYIYFSLIMD